jgi:hypothetical protein
MQQLLALFDVPAYVRRGLRVQQAFDDLIADCRRRRGEWLEVTRALLGVLRGLAGGWDALRPILADDEQLNRLRRLEAELDPRPRLAEPPTTSRRALRRALRELRESLQRFNRRWAAFLAEADLSPVNALRDGYNRYYILEKECASRSPRTARHGFRPLPPLTADDLAALLPPLPVPRGKGDAD